MQEIDIRIQELNKTICENIELIDFYIKRLGFSKYFITGKKFSGACSYEGLWYRA